jgi:putative RNA 2'-phosphotransferase
MRPERAERTPEERVSRLLALILRHQPDKFGITLDEHGYAPLEEIAKVVSERYDFVNADWLRAFVESPEGRRFVIQNDRIAARYGHSVDVEPDSAPVEPPEVLYHGTHPRNRAKIFREGIVSVGRKFCHLSSTPEEAREVGRRRAARPLILAVDARRMQQDGFLFFRAGHIYLTHRVPGKYVRVHEE